MANKKKDGHIRPDYVLITYDNETFRMRRDKALEKFSDILKTVKDKELYKQALEIHYQLRGGEGRCYPSVNPKYDAFSQHRRKGKKKEKPITVEKPKTKKAKREGEDGMPPININEAFAILKRDEEKDEGELFSEDMDLGGPEPGRKKELTADTETKLTADMISKRTRTHKKKK